MFLSISDVRPSSVTDNLRGERGIIIAPRLWKKIVFFLGIIPSSPLKLSVNEDSQVAEIGVTIKICMWNWHITYSTSHHGEHALYWKKKLFFISNTPKFSSGLLDLLQIDRISISLMLLVGTTTLNTLAGVAGLLTQEGAHSRTSLTPNNSFLSRPPWLLHHHGDRFYLYMQLWVIIAA